MAVMINEPKLVKTLSHLSGGAASNQFNLANEGTAFGSVHDGGVYHRRAYLGSTPGLLR